MPALQTFTYEAVDSTGALRKGSIESESANAAAVALGGQKLIPAKEMLRKKPEEIIRLAVKRMIPKGPQGYKQIKKLKLFAGPAHEHQAQQPVEFNMPATA